MEDFDDCFDNDTREAAEQFMQGIFDSYYESASKQKRQQRQQSMRKNKSNKDNISFLATKVGGNSVEGGWVQFCQSALLVGCHGNECDVLAIGTLFFAVSMN